jgi:DNA-binding transcriptional MerR regulator
MPYKEKPIERKYFPIGYVARDLGVAPSLIRFWEKQFPSVRPKKNKNGKRLYTKKEVEQLKIIYLLVKEKGYTLSGARSYLEKSGSSDEDKLKVIESLKDLKKFLSELRESL